MHFLQEVDSHLKNRLTVARGKAGEGVNCGKKRKGLAKEHE